MPFRIVAASTLTAPERGRAIEVAETIFWATSAGGGSLSGPSRALFLERWFGRYLKTDPSVFLIAFAANGDVAGYLAGCADTFASANYGIVRDIPFYTPLLFNGLHRFPSHFHVNVAPHLQSRGIGRNLVGRFTILCRGLGSPGVHVITAQKSRAVPFYGACGFAQQPVNFAAGAASLAVMTQTLLEPGPPNERYRP